MVKQANQMKARVNKTILPLKVGDIVQIPMANVDLSKADNKTLTMVIVKETIHKKAPPSYKLANHLFSLSRKYHPSYLRLIKNADPATLNLNDVLSKYQGLPELGERQAVRQMSLVGGQGKHKCNCKGKCSTKRCPCRKKNVSCSILCHPGNLLCENC